MHCDTWVCTKKGISYLDIFMIPYSSLCWGRYHPSSWEKESDEAWNIPPLDASDYRDNVPWSIIFFAHKRKSKIKPFHFLFNFTWNYINYIMCQLWSNVDANQTLYQALHANRGQGEWNRFVWLRQNVPLCVRRSCPPPPFGSFPKLHPGGLLTVLHLCNAP